MSNVSKEKVDQIINYTKQGMIVSDIVKTAGISRHIVENILEIYNIQPARKVKKGSSCYIPTEKAVLDHIEHYQKVLDIVRLYKSGKTFQEIADFYGVSRQCIHLLLKRSTN